MKAEMVMPKMGESITEGTILKWLKKVGDALEKDEIILEISTDKVDSEIPTPFPGTLVEILAAEGDVVEVGKPIALIETEAKAEAAGFAAPAEAHVLPQAAETNRPAPIKTKGKRFYSPVVMKIADAKDLPQTELESIPGSGLNGRVTKKDILAYLENRPDNAASKTIPETAEAAQNIPRSGNTEVVAMDNMRKRIAENMIRSKQISAHVSLFSEVDMENINRIRRHNNEAFKQREGFSLTYMPFIVEATVKALKEFPFLNAAIEGENILLKKYYNIGIAVAVEKGLIVPNIFQADGKSLLGLARSVNDLAQRARKKKLLPDELADGTFSISNFGVYDTLVGFPIINQPQAAILGIGTVKKRAVVINDAIAIRPVMYLSLTIDHRLIDGAMGSLFLERVRALLENYDERLSV